MRYENGGSNNGPKLSQQVNAKQDVEGKELSLLIISDGKILNHRHVTDHREKQEVHSKTR